jgi:tetratricopeptide (TPR) repeat protein
VPLPARTPLSLDPPSTRAHIARAAAALATFIVAYHLASGEQRRRHWFTRAVGLAGLVALAVGLGHRVFGFAKIYDLVPSGRTLIIGPFVNSNNTAELLELAGFACIACAQLRPTALNRFSWSFGAALCLAGTVATLSRGGVGAVGVGLLAYLVLRYLVRDQNSPRPRRATLVWGAVLAGTGLLLAVALGGHQLLSRFRSVTPTQDIRFQLWRDSLRVLWAHPFGIGRGAFDRVYPVYRTLKTTLSLRFGFVENEPLQLLIDSGGLLFLALVAAFAFAAWRIHRHGRRDRIEAALIAGLLAVLVHNLVDFGLEVTGVLLPFVAILGTVLGRLEPSGALLPSRSRWVLVTGTCASLLLGAASIAHGSYDDFDALLKRSRDRTAQAQLLARAQKAHPTDYFYPLQDASFEALAPQPGTGFSPRLHTLNRALQLCPSCGAVHDAIARNLWQLSFRRQALLEWRSAVKLDPPIFLDVFGEMYRGKATADEMVAVGSIDLDHMLGTATFLSRVSHHGDALTVLDRAESLGAREADVLPMRAELQLVLGRLSDAQATVARAHAAGIRDSRLALLEAQLLQRTRGSDGADQALAILEQAATQDPTSVDVQRARVQLVMAYGKWTVAERAIEGFRQALYMAHGSANEAHRVAAQIHGRLGRWNQAISDYRLALSDAPDDVQLWMALGHAAQSVGKISVAREAYQQVLRLVPQDQAGAAALRDLDTAARPTSRLETLGSQGE